MDAHIATGMASFLLVAAVFLWSAVASARNTRNEVAFFHFSGTGRNFVKLLTATLTVGTGLSYLMLAGGQHGTLMLALPMATFLGFWLLSWFAKDVVHPDIFAGRNFLDGISKGIRDTTKTDSWIGPIVAVPLVFVFLLIFGFELFVSSQIIAVLVFHDSDLKLQFGISVGLFLMTFLYCMMGGAQALARIEYVQITGIAVFVGALVFAALRQSGIDDLAARSVERFVLDVETVAVVGFASISAITTQFYNLMNMHAASNLVDGGERKRMLFLVGISVLGLFSLFVLLGVSFDLDWDQGLASALTSLFTGAGAERYLPEWALFVIVVGLLSIVISTIDVLMVTLTMFTKKNVLERFRPRTGKDSLSAARKTMALLFVSGFCVLSFFSFLQPNLFYLLLGIAGGVSVYTPLIVLCGVLSRHPEQRNLGRLGNGKLLGYLGLFAGALLMNLWALHHETTLVPWIGICAFALSTILSFAIGFRSGPKPSGKLEWRSGM